MQLDNTRIVVRERNQVELLDLAMFLLRTQGGRIFTSALIGIFPIALFNYLLFGWMGSSDFHDYAGSFIPFRYVWTMSLVVFLEAPLATVFTTMYVGLAVFEDNPSWREVIRGVLRSWSQILVGLVVVRGPFLAWFLLAISWEEPSYSFAEFCILIVTGVAGLVRGVRTFYPEVAVLEHNPWRSPHPQVMTLGRRLSLLHSGLNVSLFPRWLVVALMSFILAGAIAHGFLFLSGIFLHNWRWGPLMAHVGIPAAMWIVATYVAVVRYLSYLDTRIRNEGWEVELRLRMEGGKLQPKLT